MLYSKGRFCFIQFIYIDTENLDDIFLQVMKHFFENLWTVSWSFQHPPRMSLSSSQSIMWAFLLLFRSFYKISLCYDMIGIVITQVSQKSKIFLINSVMIRKAKCQLLIFKQSGVSYGKHRRFFFTYHHVFQAHTHISR